MQQITTLFITTFMPMTAVKVLSCYVGRVTAARVAGKAAPGPFRYHDQGSLAIVGRAAAVASLPHLEMTGFPAWLLWSCVHLALLDGLRNRALVYIQWVSAWLTHGRGALLIETDIEGLQRADSAKRDGHAD